MHMYSYDSEFQHYLTTNLYIFYEAANSYDLTILCDLSKPQWQVGLGAGLGVSHSYKFLQIVQKCDLAKIEWICTSEVIRVHTN